MGWGLVVLALARIVAAAVPASPWWGLDVLRYVDPLFAIVLWLIPAVLLVPGISDRAEALLMSLDEIASSARIPWTGLVPIVAATIVLAVPDRVWFIGDFILRQGTVLLRDDAPSLPQVLPLDDLLHLRLPQLLSIDSIQGANRYARFVGAIDAALLASLALQWGNLLGGTLRERALLAMIAFFGGFLTVFTGFGKSSAEQCVVTLAVGVFGMRVLRGGSLFPVGASLALGFLLHRSLILLLPAFLFLAIVRVRRREIQRFDVVALLLVVGTLAAVGPRIVHIFRTFDLPRYADGGTGPGVLDPRHWRNVLNLLLVLSPVGVVAGMLALVAASAERRMQQMFLGLLIVPQLVTVLAGPPAQGLFRDWDVFAPLGVTLSMAASWGSSLLITHPDWPRIALPAAATAASCALAWMFHFADLKRGLARIETHARTSKSLNERERAAAWEFLGFRYRFLGDARATAAAHAEVVKLKPSRYLYVSWALAEYQARNPAGARAAFDSLTRRYPGYPLGWYGYAAASVWVEDSSGVRRGVDGVRRTLKTAAEAREIQRFVRMYPFVAPDSSMILGP